eukprot:2704333-Pleurochrysis_carterae.AAC.1
MSVSACLASCEEGVGVMRWIVVALASFQLGEADKGSDCARCPKHPRGTARFHQQLCMQLHAFASRALGLSIDEFVESSMAGAAYMRCVRRCSTRSPSQTWRPRAWRLVRARMSTEMRI